MLRSTGSLPSNSTTFWTPPGEPFALRLDWWLGDEDTRRLKTWAGQQKVFQIAEAMKVSIPKVDAETSSVIDILERSVVVRAQAPRRSGKPVEPFYFDATRNADRLDTGFSLDRQEAEVVAHPATEFLCLVGLQRFRPPQMNGERWAFCYTAWPIPLSAVVAPAWLCGSVDDRAPLYRFPILFRDEQRRYKAFGYAVASERTRPSRRR